MKGIYMKPDLVRATIQGLKTETMRTGGLKHINRQPDVWEVKSHDGAGTFCFADCRHNISSLSRFFPIMCRPRHSPGETVYIREAFMFKKGADIREQYIGTADEGCLGFPPHYLYKMDDTEEVKDYGKYYKWRSPMAMPGHAARYFIRIKFVWPMRVQAITYDQAYAEGMGRSIIMHDPIEDLFAPLWDSSNPKYPWSLNPWAWRYEYEFLQWATWKQPLKGVGGE